MIEAQKPRLTYAQFLAQQHPQFTPFTIAWVIERVIKDVEDNPELKQIGQSKLYILCALQRSYLGEKDALTEKLKNFANPNSQPNIAIDGRWLAIGVTDLQKGFMAVIRSIARPTTF